MNSSFPTYIEYLLVLQERFKAWGLQIPLQDFTMAGNSTNLKVVMKEPDVIQASQPYFEITFIRALEGHDDVQSRSKGLEHNQTHQG